VPGGLRCDCGALSGQIPDQFIVSGSFLEGFVTTNISVFCFNLAV
jgi:hypothetical protein